MVEDNYSGRVREMCIEEFNIQRNIIPNFINEIAQNLSTKRKKPIEKYYKSVFDFVAILYYFRFIEKLEISEIAHVLDFQVQPLHIHLYNFGWHYSKDFEQNNLEYEKEHSKLLNILTKAKIQALKLNVNEHYKLAEALNNTNIMKETYNKLGFRKSDYIKTMYHLIFIDELTTVELVVLFKIPYSTMHLRVKRLGFNLKLEEAMIKKKEKKRQNYEKSIRAGKVTRLNSQYENLTDGSKNEEYARQMLAKLAYEYFSSDNYDVVVGVSNIGILSQKELDIPIIIFNKMNNKLYRFALEYNGETYHDEDKDAIKVNIAKEKGWIYISIIEKSNGRESNNSKIIIKKVRGICQKMKKIIDNELFL